MTHHPHCRGRCNLPPDVGIVAAWALAAKSWCSAVAIGIAAATLAFALPAQAQDDAHAAGMRLESSLAAYPQRTLQELAQWSHAQDNVAPSDRRYLMGLYGQAMVQAGHVADARELADRLDAEAGARSDALLAVDAKLIRSAVQWRAGDATAAGTLAQEARDALRGKDDLFLAYWAALAAGVTSRARGQFEAAVENLQVALVQADRADDANRRAEVRYQLSVLSLALKQPQQAFEESQQAFRQAVLAQNPFVMAKAKMAESASLEKLQRPGEELEALDEALAIARTTQSETAEGMALVNLADIYLRRREFRTAYDLSRGALDVARETDDASLMATSKANMGFALLAQNRIDAGKRLADEALADYERAGATAEIASLLGEYGHYLEDAGDYKSALVLLHRERRLHDEISLEAHEKAVLEMQGRHESERRKREIEFLNRDNAQKSAELETRRWQERVSWLAAVAFAALFAVVALLYRKLRLSNRLLADRNHELRSQSARDPLTSLYNRRHFQDFIRVAPAGDDDDGDSRANTQGLLLLDLDHFKTVNDRHGHAGGDAVDRHRGAPARNAARRGHGRALGRRGVPGLRARGQPRSPRRHCASPHGRGIAQSSHVSGRCDPPYDVDRIRAGADAPGRRRADVGARTQVDRPGVVHGEAARPQSRVWHREDRERRSVRRSRARSTGRMGTGPGRDAGAGQRSAARHAARGKASEDFSRPYVTHLSPARRVLRF
jgi:GGDEF domain-containing protein